MKEPSEIYHDEFLREVERHTRPSTEGPGHPREITREEVLQAERIAAEAAAQHLVDYLGFTAEEAEDAAEEFRKAGPASTEALRNVWTDIQLRRGRLHRPR